jgi:glutamine amidotransferase
MIAIIDYGMGNIHSVRKALELCGSETIVTNKPGDLRLCQKIVFPGVGAFDDAAAELKKENLAGALKEEIAKGKPFLGICLGMQLLFQASEEANKELGLAVLKGRVRRFQNQPGLKVPHMGWNNLEQRVDNCPLLKGIADNSFVYFCHSFYPDPDDPKIVAAACDYGKPFAALVWQKNVFGVQFHPEKSQEAGLKILKNFVEIC